MISTSDFTVPLKRLGLSLDKTLLEKCKVLCDIYSVSAESLLDQLDAFLSNDDASVLSLQNFGKFEQAVKLNNTKVKISCCDICFYGF